MPRRNGRIPGHAGRGGRIDTEQHGTVTVVTVRGHRRSLVARDRGGRTLALHRAGRRWYVSDPRGTH